MPPMYDAPAFRSFCHLDHTSNGVLVMYYEAEARTFKDPDGPGLDFSQFGPLFEGILSAQQEGEDWNEEKKEKINLIKKAFSQMSPSSKAKQIYFLVEKTIFCSSLDEIPKAISQAYGAYQNVTAIRKEGHSIFTDTPFTFGHPAYTVPVMGRS